MDSGVIATCERIGALLKSAGGRLVTVESCTGGGVAWHITAVAGSSEWFDRALVTYSNEAKSALAGVPADLIACHGAVSEETAAAMARGGTAATGISHALSVTGIAGPGGGSEEKPVGMVCFGWASRLADGATETGTETRVFSGDRQAIRLASIRYALDGQLAILQRQLG